jgi:hypothetical protein
MEVYKSGHFITAPIVIDECNRLLINKDYERLLSLIKSFVLTVFRSPGIHNQTLFLREFDEILLKISQDMRINRVINQVGVNDLNIIIGTEFYSVGGHTRIAKEIAAHKKNTVVIVTDAYSRCDENSHYFRQFQDLFACTPLFVLPPGLLLEKINYFVQLLSVLNPKSAVIMTHHDDPIGIVAVAQSDIPKKIYYHHCDYNPALGATIESFCHYDLSPYVGNICKEHAKSNYLPLMYKIKYFEKIKFNKEAEFNLLCSGSAIKFNFSDENSKSYYPKAISKILNAISCRFYHIGDLGASELSLIEGHLHSNNIDLSRFCYLGAVSDIPKIIFNLINPVYISSFPIPGGLTLVEVLSTGVPILQFNYKNSNSDFVISDYTYASLLPKNVIKFNNFFELNELLLDLKENYNDVTCENIMYFEEFHSEKAVHHALEKMFN